MATDHGGGRRFLQGLVWLAAGLALLAIAGWGFAGAHQLPIRAAFWLLVAVFGAGLAVAAPVRHWRPARDGEGP